MNRMKVANYIKELRIGRAWSQAQLADIASVNIRTIQRLEKNGQSSYETLLAVAAAFDIDVQDLVAMHDQGTLFENVPATGGRTLSILCQSFTVSWLTPKSTFWLGIVLIFPALFFISASIARYNLGVTFLFEPWEWLFSIKQIWPFVNNILPLVFLGGITTAALLNLSEIFSVSLSKNESWFKGHLMFHPQMLNVLIVATCIFMLIILFAYVFAENFVSR